MILISFSIKNNYENKYFSWHVFRSGFSDRKKCKRNDLRFLEYNDVAKEEMSRV